jgi:hypothetical protein
MRPAIAEFVSLGTMPSEDDAPLAQLEVYERLVRAFEPPASDEEAAAMAQVLPDGDDSLFGMVWSAVHFIETAPSWPIVSSLRPVTGWRRVMWERGESAGRLPAPPMS